MFQKNNDSQNALEFQKVLNIISDFSFSAYGRRKIFNLIPPENPEYILSITKEFKEMMLIEGEPPIGSIFDLKFEIERAKKGFSLNPEQLNKISRTMKGLKQLKDFFENLAEKYENIWKVAQNIHYEEDLVKKIDRCINEDFSIKDNASDELKKIRHQLKVLNRSLPSKLEKIKLKYRNSLASELIIERDGRYVLSLESSKKSTYQGIVHGTSASGATTYFEPSELIQINNDLRSFKASEENEIRRILSILTHFFVSLENNIFETIETLEKIDFMYACTRYSKKYKANFIIPNVENKFVLNNARHPLIDIDKVIPSDFYMNPDIKSVIVTGPNTGGKTVAIKTIGLAVIMMMHGLPVLADETSAIPYFENIFVDIGDEQSIEQNLSTFSSHMKKLIKILKEADDKSLVLIDEMGSGTDPMEGSSLSLAIINRLIKKGVRSIITTHLTPIKISAMENKNIENACVEFDVQTLMPTYRLIMGIPGNSNAIEISKRLGLDIDLIDEAKKRVGSKSIELQNIIGKLHNQSSFVEKQKRELQMKNDEVQELKSTLQGKIEKLKVKKYEEVSEEIYKLEKKLEDIVKEIEQNISLSKSDDRKEKVKALKNIQKLRKNITVENIESSPKIVSGKIDIGDHVKLIDGSSVGVVEKINGNDIWVKFGSMNLNIKREKLLKIEKTENKNDDKSQFISIPPSKINNNEIDIRGKISDEVPFIVEDFIEDLRRTGESEGFIIHGKGTGVLAQSVWRFLRRNQRIKSFRVGTPKEGGHGVTVIQL